MKLERKFAIAVVVEILALLAAIAIVSWAA